MKDNLDDIIKSIDKYEAEMVQHRQGMTEEELRLAVAALGALRKLVAEFKKR